MTPSAPAFAQGASLPLRTRSRAPRAQCIQMRASPSQALSRRAVLAAAAAAAALPLLPARAAPAAPAAPAFALPPLPYAYDALQPHISEETMHLHHDKHFASYTANLNAALAKLPNASVGDDAALRGLLADLGSVSDEAVRVAIRNNGGGYLNHKAYFETMQGKGRSSPSAALSRAIDAEFGSFGAFEDEFTAAALSLFGSGFVWLVKDGPSGKLRISKYANQDNPAMDGNGSVALLGCDTWEHAYYADRRNRKPEYVEAWWNVVDYGPVEKLFAAV